MKIVTQTANQLVLKDGNWVDWARIVNGSWAVLLSTIFMYMSLSSVDYVNFFSTNNIVSLVGLFPFFVLIFGMGIKFISISAWATLTIDKSQDRIDLHRKIVFKTENKTFRISDIASIELTKVWQQQNKQSVLLHQIVLDTKEGTKTPFGHESKELGMEKVAQTLAEFLGVPFQLVSIPLGKWGGKLPPYNKFRP